MSKQFYPFKSFNIGTQIFYKFKYYISKVNVSKSYFMIKRLKIVKLYSKVG
jgi:hypothetical protein